MIGIFGSLVMAGGVWWVVNEGVLLWVVVWGVGFCVITCVCVCVCKFDSGLPLWVVWLWLACVRRC